MMNKSELRKWAKEQRKILNIEDISKTCVGKIRQTKEYKSAKNVMLFYPLKEEISLLELLNDKDKNFYLPKIDGKNLLCCLYKNGDELSDSCFKTKEPLTEPMEKSILDLIIVPALACDKNGYRLGYGRGFYDRFLSDMKTSTISCIPKELFLDTIYHEQTDVKIGFVIVV